MQDRPRVSAGLPVPLAAAAQAIRDQFVTEDPQEREPRRERRRKHHLPDLRTIRRRLYANKVGAAPGGSGLRNSHLLLLTRTQGRCEALTAWVHMWLKDQIHSDTALLWLQVVLIPIQKPNGGLRPIALPNDA